MNKNVILIYDMKEWDHIYMSIKMFINIYMVPTPYSYFVPTSLITMEYKPRKNTIIGSTYTE